MDLNYFVNSKIEIIRVYSVTLCELWGKKILVYEMNLSQYVPRQCPMSMLKLWDMYEFNIQKIFRSVFVQALTVMQCFFRFCQKESPSWHIPWPPHFCSTSGTSLAASSTTFLSVSTSSFWCS